MTKKARTPRAPKPRSVRYSVIPQEDPAYNILRKARDKWHQEIDQAKIVLAFWKSVKADKDGILKLGRIHHSSDLHREFMPWDFIILLNEEAWRRDEFTDKHKLALLDHELCHVTTANDKNDNVRTDERNRVLYRMRRHDIEEFRVVVRRHGCYKADLEEFAKVLIKKVDAPLLAKLDPPAEAPEVPSLQ